VINELFSLEERIKQWQSKVSKVGEKDNHRKSRTYMRWLTISKLPLQARFFACVVTLDCQLYALTEGDGFPLSSQ
jgi:hypothetical protein